MTPIDTLLSAADNALRTLSGTSHPARPMPQPTDSPALLSDSDRRLSGALMRVNHVGEVCAQAMYSAQAMSTRNPAMRHQFEDAARDETDHLAWTQKRLVELGARPSFLNPLWYVGAFGVGWLAGRSGDARSLGFVMETERQVEEHLDRHLQRLPTEDLASRAIVRQMSEDEARHGAEAAAAGAVRLPALARWAMRMAARVMTTTAHCI